MTPSPSVPSLESLRAAAQQLGEELSARLIVLFGSAARAGTAPKDVDIGILCDRPLDAVDAANRLTRSLGTQGIDVADLRQAEPLLLALVARDGIPLYQARPGTFAAFASLAARRFADTRKFREAERREIEDFLGARGAPQ